MSVTIKDIAEEFGVAPSTVSNALNSRNKGTYQRSAARAEQIRTYAAKRGYRPSAAARAVRSKRTFQIGVLLPNRPGHPHTHPSAFEGVLGINSGMQDAGYIVSVIRFDDLTRDVTSHTRLFCERSLDGLIVFGLFPEWAQEELEQLVPHIVWMDTNTWKDEHCLRRDEAAAGRLAIEQVAKLGYRRVVWLGYPNDVSPCHFSHQERRTAAFAEAERLGLPIEEAEVKPWAGLDEWHGLEDRLTPDTAVIAESVYHAEILSHRVAGMGLTMPRDFGLACCDASQEIDRLWPGLCRVSFNRFEMGRKASDMLRTMLDKKSQPIPSQHVRVEWVQGTTMQKQSELQP